MVEKNIKVRIAPSPSGYLHVGTARTAIFNWLFARHQGGQFVVRIEDTDPQRSRPELIKPILDSLTWLGIDWDEEPSYQSQRISRYKVYVDKLLASGSAYRCFCRPEDLEKKRQAAMAEKKSPSYDQTCRSLNDKEVSELLAKNKPFAVRLKIPDGSTTYDDLILGKITKSNSEIEDFVVCREDGSAVYNMAVVVDDHEMGITHVIRGNDHINNTFKQIHIYNALGIDVPIFGHVPLILRPDRGKVSKRKGDKSVAEYGQEGILPEALFNFLCLLGWSPKDDREYLTREELIRIFNIKDVNRANPIFDEDKLVALNQSYIKNMPTHKLADIVAPMLIQADYATKYWLETRWQYLLKIIDLLKERCRRTTDFVAQSQYFFHSEFTYNPAAIEKQFDTETRKYLVDLNTAFGENDSFTKENLESILNGISEKAGIKRSRLIHPVRLAVTGTTEGPGLFDILETIGKDETILRINKAIAFIENKGGLTDESQGKT
jgi:glutamyl-tRNA synthetase